MNGRDRGGAAAERIRARLARTGSARRDAVAKARNTPDLRPYDDESEITGRFAAIAEDALKVARAAQRASQHDADASIPPAVKHVSRLGKVAKALGGALVGFVALAKALGWI
jgi:hypothetical protein